MNKCSILESFTGKSLERIYRKTGLFPGSSGMRLTLHAGFAKIIPRVIDGFIARVKGGDLRPDTSNRNKRVLLN